MGRDIAVSGLDAGTSFESWKGNLGSKWVGLVRRCGMLRGVWEGVIEKEASRRLAELAWAVTGGARLTKGREIAKKKAAILSSISPAPGEVGFAKSRYLRRERFYKSSGHFSF